MTHQMESEPASTNYSSHNVFGVLDRMDARAAVDLAAALRKHVGTSLQEPKYKKQRVEQLTEEPSGQEIDMGATRQEVQDGPTERLREHIETVSQALQYLLYKIKQLEKKNEAQEDRLAAEDKTNLSLERQIRQMRKDHELLQLLHGARKLLFEQSQTLPN